MYIILVLLDVKIAGKSDVIIAGDVALENV